MLNAIKNSINNLHKSNALNPEIIFCSKSCSASYNNLGVRRNPAAFRTCKGCESRFQTTGKHRSRLYCQECLKGFTTVSEKVQEEFKATPVGEYRRKSSVKHKHPSWANSHVRSFNRSWNKELTEKPCANCGYAKHVELAHKKAIADFDDSATLGEINHPDNVIQLCRNCHWEFDNGLLTLSI